MKGFARFAAALAVVLLGGTAAAAPAWLPQADPGMQPSQFQLKACPGCCSSHGGITSSCGSGGRILCADGTTSPSCTCSSCGVNSGPPACFYIYSDWSACQPGGTRTRTILSSGAPGCVGSPGPLVESCTYTAPACSYTYSEWSACQANGTQTRTLRTSAPSGCSGTPAITQPCIYTAPGGINYTALWWNATESGWGVNVNHQDSILFVTIFTYGTNGLPMWLVGSNVAQQSDGAFIGPLYRITGPGFDAKPWSQVQATQVGNVSLRFNGFGGGSITYNVNAVSVTKQIEKQVFASNVTCTGTSASRLGASNYQDLWWNPQESGWGINFAHQGDVLFATLFTYDRSGIDLWLVASAMTKQADGSYAGALYKTTGVSFNAATWRSATATQVGSMTVKFSDGEDGVLTYVYNGTTVTKQIKRQAFASVVPVCH